MAEHKSVRLSQSVSPFGVGAIYDVLGESFVACDITLWGTRGVPVQLNRLARSLGVDGFRHAPTRPDFFGPRHSEGIPYMRFPEWMFCSRCRRMTRLKIDYAASTPKCRTCQGSPGLVAMRFVQICGRGHLGDVDWWWWAHSGKHSIRCEKRREELKFKVNTSAGGGLASLVVEAACGAERSLDRVTGKDALKTVGASCNGGQPWQRGNALCKAVPQVVQRGASNLHYSRITSALDIPPESNARKNLPIEQEIELNQLFTKALSSVNDAGVIGFIGQNVVSIIADDLDTEESLVESVVLRAWAKQQGLYPASDDATAEADLEFGEYLAFLTPRDDQDDEDRFITQHVPVGTEEDGVPPLLAAALSELCGQVVLALRLREVRAMTGFTRLQPGGDDVEVIPPALGRRVNWLPAIEVTGEGIFLGFRENYVSTWENNPAVMERVHATQIQWTESGYEWLPHPSARFLALHTLAHVLIRQLTFDCGYSSASLREKVYARPPHQGPPMAGILIYTASGDSEGSMGGLVRQGSPDRLAQTIAAALATASWCSSDPVCSEVRSGPSGLNLGACHACSLVAETSCTSGNLLLDRTLLIGDESTPGLLRRTAEAVIRSASQASQDP
jgi:hypothetical protein